MHRLRPRSGLRVRSVLPAIIGLLAPTTAVQAQSITTAGQPARLEIRAAGEHSVRVTLAPVSFDDDVPFTPALAADRAAAEPALSLTSIHGPVSRRVGRLDVEVRPDPLTVAVTAEGRPVQTLVFQADGRLTFPLDGEPVLGLGEGGPRPERGVQWREQPVEFDRRGRLHRMEPRWQSDMYGSRNPVAMLVGTGGWGLFVATPWVLVDLSAEDRGAFIPWQPPEDAAPQDRRNQGQNLGKGVPPIDGIVPGLFDVFVFDGHDPAVLMRDFSRITGPAAMPPKWALGYMQSHRTLEDDAQLLEVIDTFREKEIPVDAVIYLGTGFCPQGWNTEQPSFTFNPEVFDRDPAAVLADMEARHVRTVVHMVPWDRDRLPTLHGTIPPGPGETVDAGHIQRYWREHVPLLEAGIDAFWPDEGDWFNLFERLKRHQMYYQGHLQHDPDVRPWHLQRNGHAGIAQWGGWVWSGDTQSAWKTLEAQIAVGLNYSLSIGPYWGSDIGGFYPSAELTGELYARWFQLGAFSGSFRSHGRTWWTRLPWGWGLNEMGPLEVNNTNTIRDEDDRRRLPLESELGNPAIEPVTKKYAELRYRLMPYTYTLAWEARATGLPLMRALWLHYPEDDRVRDLADQFLWGRDLLIAPVHEEGATSWDVYLPEGVWYDWWTGQRANGGRTVTRPVDLATMPIYVRAGAIIPVDPVRQYTDQPVSQPTTLQVYRGAHGEFTLYEDDGISQRYLDGVGSWIRMTWDDGARSLTLEPGAPAGAANRDTTRTFNVLLLPDAEFRTVTYSGSPVTVSFERRGRGERTEAAARSRAEANRAERRRIREATGLRVELIPDYVDAAVGPVPDSLGVDPFYRKYVDAGGIPVLASERTPDAALLVARDIVDTMLRWRPDLRAALVERGWRTGVIAETEMTMDIPEYADFRAPGRSRDQPVTQEDRDYHANRSRGMGGNPTTGAEENLLGYPGTRYFGETIFVHELAHAIHRAIRDVDPDMADEVRSAYDSAMARGLYRYGDGRRHYATTNAGEYWAEGVQWWFYSNYGECFAGDVVVESPQQLEAYDPALFELIGRVFRTHRIPMDAFHGRRVRPVSCDADDGG